MANIDNEAARDSYITSAIEESCVGCEEIPDYDRETGEVLMGWRPAERCPVHGVDVDEFWAALNADCRRRFPQVYDHA